ncbi:cobalt-precorrin-6A reductase [Paracoccus aestuariivivens]|uniref:Cobalt-precorrin-6A reductase n=1 Tax=Paracoccus aestuariivivens TaxID=1820333 RepID=A0A6L6JCT1_9RHOB|nr:cobalt-precorrin-6A reductase [Paracoccus aestuariivivens]MTH79770.1 cobalt-precorrin-6A reductase [Paracoccus aestuariivivens]
MSPNVLILGGTTEASALVRRMAESGIRGLVSLAGRVESPRLQALPMRVGGFGGVDGLAQYLREQRFSQVIDATHPFAAQMSCNAVLACAKVQVPLLRLTRPPWLATDGDRWTIVADIPAAVAALNRPAMRVMLAVGRMHLDDFAPNPQHFYLLRLIDPPLAALPLPDVGILVDRGPFHPDPDRALMQKHAIDLVVSKNSGGEGAYAKIAAARSLGIPVLMIDRPEVPAAIEVHHVDEALLWLHASTERGV